MQRNNILGELEELSIKNLCNVLSNVICAFLFLEWWQGVSLAGSLVLHSVGEWQKIKKKGAGLWEVLYIHTICVYAMDNQWIPQF